MDPIHPFEVIRQEILIRYHINAEPLQKPSECSAVDKNGVPIRPV